MDDKPIIRLPHRHRQPSGASGPNGRYRMSPYADQPTVPMRNKAPRQKRKMKPIVLALVIFLFILLIGGGTLSAIYYFTVHNSVNQFIRPVGRGANEPPSNTSGTYDGIRGRSWNILLMGSDNDGKYNFPALLTQVMMVIHVNTDTNTVSMVSIPRDSWVYVPQIGGMHKIDQAFFLGASSTNKFEDGVRIARQTIERDYGLTIDRYAWVGLSGFARVIDTLGGVDVDVTHPVVDDAYPNDTGNGASANDPYAYKRLYIPPGPQHLNGSNALEYVRSRHADLVGDIGRTQRQQQILQALKQKLNVTSIVQNLPALLKDLTGQVYTDFSEDEMIAFANFGRSLNANSIQRVTLGPGQGSQNYGRYDSVYDPATNSNQDVIIPNCETIQPTISHVFELNALSPGCNVTQGVFG
jgi:LCP family protein required for cell wall assembly